MKEKPDSLNRWAEITRKRHKERKIEREGESGDVHMSRITNGLTIYTHAKSPNIRQLQTTYAGCDAYESRREQISADDQKAVRECKLLRRSV